MPSYSLKQFLLENETQCESVFRADPVSRLVANMKKTEVLKENLDRPIVPKGTGWDHLTAPNRLRRTFDIENSVSRRIFINDVLNLADQTMHHIELNILMEKVTIEVYTDQLNDITEMDFEYASDIDEMYVDAMFSSSNNKDLGDTHDLW